MYFAGDRGAFLQPWIRSTASRLDTSWPASEHRTNEPGGNKRIFIFRKMAISPLSEGTADTAAGNAGDRGPRLGRVVVRREKMGAGSWNLRGCRAGQA
jgi:hypothetical protein